jgi:hypothetical protein
MKYLRYLTIVLALMLVTGFAFSSEPSVSTPEPLPELRPAAEVPDYTDSFVDYGQVERQLAELRRQLAQPNILKEDIVRGWYLADRSEKKYGTPSGWIFVEDGDGSRWMSPHFMEEESLIDNRRLCERTAGKYLASCLDTADTECEYVTESHCECSYGTKWHEEQGCILTSEAGAYVAINQDELEKGWYSGLPNQKKLNTPVDWEWVEKGRDSAWMKSN